MNLLLQVRGVQEGLRGLACRVCHFYHLGHGDPEEHEVEKDITSTFEDLKTRVGLPEK